MLTKPRDKDTQKCDRAKINKFHADEQHLVNKESNNNKKSKQLEKLQIQPYTTIHLLRTDPASKNIRRLKLSGNRVIDHPDRRQTEHFYLQCYMAITLRSLSTLQFVLSLPHTC